MCIRDRFYGLEQRQRFVAAVRHSGRISSDLQVLSDDLGVVGVIVDHQNRWFVGRCHVCPVQVARCLAPWKTRQRRTKGKSQATYRRLNAYETPTPYSTPLGPPSVGARVPPNSTPSVTPIAEEIAISLPMPTRITLPFDVPPE